MNELVTKERLELAREVSRKVGYTGVSWLQRQMRIGYMTASYLLDALVEEGFCVREEGSHVYKVRAQQSVYADAGDSAPLEALSTPEHSATSQTLSTPTQRG